MGLALFYVVIAFSNYKTVVLIPLTYKSVGTGRLWDRAVNIQGMEIKILLKPSGG